MIPLAQHRLLVAALALLLLAGCSKPAPIPPPVTTPPVTTPPPPPKATERTIDWWLSQLTVEEQVGQLFWFGLPGPELSPEAQTLIKEGKAGGFVLFARQGSDPVKLAALTSGLQRLTFERGRPSPGLVISIDQEGGLVERFQPPFTSWPGNMAIGATGDTARASLVGTAIAQELKAVGINMDLAPDSDVQNNPANPIIGVRSFGSDPSRVGEFVAAEVQGLQSENVSAVAKHFPGHGDTGTDSHLALPVITADRKRLDEVELVPFRSAIQVGVDAVMVAHISFPALEPDGLPATLSKRVMTDLLKGELGFQGVVVTDAIDTMKAVTDHWGKTESFVKAIQAGADALLVTESFGEQATLYDAVLAAVKSGQIPRDRLTDAVRRQLTLKQKRGLLPAEGAKPTALTGALPGTGNHQRLANETGAAALTLIKGEGLPLKLAANQQLLVVSPSFLPVGGDGLTALGRSLKAVHPAVKEVRIDRSPSAEQSGAVNAAAAGSSVIVYGIDGANQAQRALVTGLLGARTFVMVGLGEPYELLAIPAVPAYLAAYGYREPNLKSVGAVLFGQQAPQGHLPVAVSAQYPLGYGRSW